MQITQTRFNWDKSDGNVDDDQILLIYLYSDEEF